MEVQETVRDRTANREEQTSMSVSGPAVTHYTQDFWSRVLFLPFLCPQVLFDIFQYVNRSQVSA